MQTVDCYDGSFLPGCTQRALAQRLGVSVYTFQHEVDSALFKLGLLARPPRRGLPVRFRARLLADAVGTPCPICGEPLSATPPLAVDHIVPWSAGGTNDPGNLRVTHWSCNARRGSGGPIGISEGAVPQERRWRHPGPMSPCLAAAPSAATSAFWIRIAPSPPPYRDERVHVYVRIAASTESEAITHAARCFPDADERIVSWNE